VFSNFTHAHTQVRTGTSENSTAERWRTDLACSIGKRSATDFKIVRLSVRCRLYRTRTGDNDVLPLKAARRDAIAKLKSFWGFESELQTDPMPFHLDSLLVLLRACAMDCGWEKNSGPILSRLWTKVHKILATM